MPSISTSRQIDWRRRGTEGLGDFVGATSSPARGRRRPRRKPGSDEGTCRSSVRHPTGGTIAHPTLADARATFSRKREKERRGPMIATDIDVADTFDLTVGEAEAGQRVDVAMTAGAKAAGLVLSRTRIKALAEAGCLTLDGAPVTNVSHKLKAGEHLTLDVPAAEDAEPQGEDIPLDVVFEDAHLIVIDKPAGLVVHPAPGHATGTLVNALIAHCGESVYPASAACDGLASSTGSTRTRQACWSRPRRTGRTRAWPGSSPTTAAPCR